MSLGSKIIALVLLASSASAQWDTNITSGDVIRWYYDADTNRVFVKTQWQTNTIAALDERADALGTTYTPPAGWYRSNRAHLTNAKAWVSANCTNFVDWTQADTNQEFEAWFATNTAATMFPHWTEATLLAAVGAPTNYLDSTPWRMLTDNTTSNGWHYLDDVVNELVWVDASGQWADSYNMRYAVSELDQPTQGGWEPSVLHLMTNLVGNHNGLTNPSTFGGGVTTNAWGAWGTSGLFFETEPDDDFPGMVLGITYQTNTVTTGYVGAVVTRTSTLLETSVATNFALKASLYYTAGPMHADADLNNLLTREDGLDAGYDIEALDEFDMFGESWPTNWVIASTTNAPAGNLGSVGAAEDDPWPDYYFGQFGPTNWPDFAVSDAPATSPSSHDEQVTAGWTMRTIVLMQYNATTNGFKYVTP